MLGNKYKGNSIDWLVISGSEREGTSIIMFLARMTGQYQYTRKEA